MICPFCGRVLKRRYNMEGGYLVFRCDPNRSVGGCGYVGKKQKKLVQIDWGMIENECQKMRIVKKRRGRMRFEEKDAIFIVKQIILGGAFILYILAVFLSCSSLKDCILLIIAGMLPLTFGMGYISEEKKERIKEREIEKERVDET